MPRLRRLADEGATFTRAFSTSCWTMPAHASLFTGLLPSRHGCHEAHRRLDERHQTLASALGEAGYATAGFTNNPWVSSRFGLDRGFAHFFKGWHLVQSRLDFARAALDAALDPDAFSDRGLVRALRSASARERGAAIVNGLYARARRRLGWREKGAARINRAIAAWLRRAPRPCFLFVNYLEAHHPYRPPEPFRSMFLPPGVTVEEALRVRQSAERYNAGLYDLAEREREILVALYDAELRYLDACFAELLAMLERELDDTILLVVADHGENVGEHHLLAHQNNLYDTVLHVPLVLRYPRAIAAGQRCEALVQLTDLVPTVAELVDLEPPATDGRPLTAALAGERREAVQAELMGPQPPVETLQRRLADAAAARRFDRQLRAVRTERHKLIVGSDGTVELYDVAADPAETQNLAPAEPVLVGELRAHVADEPGRPGSDAGEIDAETRRALEELGYLT